MSFEKAKELAALLDRHQPHQRPGFAGRPPVATGKARRRYSAHPLDSLYRRRAISKEAYVAGLRFRSDWELADVGGEGVTNYDRLFPLPKEEIVNELAFPRPSPKPVRRPPSSIPAHRYDAKLMLAKLRVITGSFGFQLMRGVAVMGIPLQAIATELKLHRDFVSLRLREALEDAAAFYGEIFDGAD